MLKHGDIWAAIDALAHDHGLTASALARRAGLDPTTFNKSKRITREGKARWPSTESLAKVLEATGASLGQFLGYIEASGGPPPRPVSTLPLIGFAQAGDQGTFDEAGLPAGTGWDAIPFPDVRDPQAYALEVSGDSLEPLFRDGDVMVVSPSANVRRGDRVVLRTLEGEMLVKQLVRMTARRVELAAIGPPHPGRNLATEEISWLARIIWVSQ